MHRKPKETELKMTAKRHSVLLIRFRSREATVEVLQVGLVLLFRPPSIYLPSIFLCFYFEHLYFRFPNSHCLNTASE